MYLHCVCPVLSRPVHRRETEYKGLQLSLDQASSKATSFPYSSSSMMDNCRTPKSKVSRLKTKARLSPYTQVRTNDKFDTTSSVLILQSGGKHWDGRLGHKLRRT